MQFDTSNYGAETVVMGAAVGVAAAAVLSSISAVVQLNRAMEDLDERMAAYADPGLIYQPIRREFILAELEKCGKLLFEQMPHEIDVMRKINIDLHKIGAEPVDHFFNMKERVVLAGKGLRNNAKAEEFVALIDQPLPPIHNYKPEQGPLHAEFTGLERMKKQHDWLTRKTRGKVYGGDYTQDSQQREASATAMWTELAEGRVQLEELARALSSENQTISDQISYAKENYRALAHLYQIAVFAYTSKKESDQVESARLFNHLYQLIESDEDQGFDKALAAVAELVKGSQKETQPA